MICNIPPWKYPVLLTLTMVIWIVMFIVEVYKREVLLFYGLTYALPFLSFASGVLEFFFPLSAVLIFVTITIRCEEIETIYRHRDPRFMNAANLCIYCIGLMFCISLCCMPNIFEFFNTGTWVKSVICMSLGMLYLILQSIFSFFWKDLPGSLTCVNSLRVVLSIINLGSFVAFVYFCVNENLEVTWIQAFGCIFGFLIPLFTLTFIPEFKKLDVKLVVSYPISEVAVSQPESYTLTHLTQFFGQTDVDITGHEQLSDDRLYNDDSVVI